jgi:hypothetical protein
MTDFTQEIKIIEEEIRKTPYHKATEHHIGKLRARLARLKEKQLEGYLKTKGGGGIGYAIKKEGDATVVLIGPPSAGKSTLLNRITNAESKVAPYSFTTVSVIPGMLKYNDAYIQILDVPGLIKGAHLGKGRGKEVISVARNAELLILISDIERAEVISNLVLELEEAGIRINKEKPLVRIEKKVAGGITIHSNINQKVSKELVKEVVISFGIKNAEIWLNQMVTLDDLIDSLSSSRVYLPAIFVINKIDTSSQVLKKDEIVYISAEKGEGIDKLLSLVWQKLNLVRIFLVRPDEAPSLANPMIVKRGDTLAKVAQSIGDEFSQNKKYARIWGKTARYAGQEVPLTTKVEEEMQVRFA